LNTKTLIVITGPTAVGKTKLTIELARHFNVPIINADSRQLFRGMEIGTAAPTDKERQQARHEFTGMLNLEDYYSASMFEQDVLSWLSQHFKEHDIALMSGGSMMYIDAVCNGIDDIPTIRDDIRTMMKQRLQEEGLEALCEELKRLDPEHYEVVDKKNTRRVVHALEICHQTGNTYTYFRKQQKKERPFHLIKIGLNRPREELYERINQRVDNMMEQGLEAEARKLYPQRQLNALNTVGYKEMFAYMDGTWTLEEAIERMKGNTRRYARKQLTWFKRDKDMKWFHPDDKEQILNYISSCI
jgi:tRNA dimethylallyltransferase